MKFLLSIALVVFMFSGCNTQPKPTNTIAKVIGGCGDNDIVITDIKGRKKSDGFMQAQILGENSSSSYQKLMYRIVWFDDNGFVIESILSKWTDVPAYANQPFNITTISPSTKAKTFRLYIKKDKEVICDKNYNGL